MIIDSKGLHPDRHYAVLPSRTFLLRDLVVTDPLNGLTTCERLNFISNLQFLNRTTARRGRNLRAVQKATVVADSTAARVAALAVAALVLCRSGLPR